MPKTYPIAGAQYLKPSEVISGKSNGLLPWNASRTICLVFLNVRDPTTVAGHRLDQTSRAVKIQVTRFLDERNASHSRRSSELLALHEDQKFSWARMVKMLRPSASWVARLPPSVLRTCDQLNRKRRLAL